MDASEYLPMFLAECREHLQELNLAVMRLEEAPHDRETVNEIFRIAHSLKGMSATMGFERMAELTHAMEDVFELLRQRANGLKREAIDVLLQCLDALDEAIETIDTEGVDGLEPQELIAQLRSLVRARTPEQELAFRGGAPDPDELRARARGRRLLHAVAELHEKAVMPAVRAYMLIAAAGEHGELVGSAPSEEGVDMFAGRIVELWIISEHEEEAVERTLADVGDVARVAVVEETFEEDGAAYAASEAPEPAPAAADSPAEVVEPEIAVVEPIASNDPVPAPDEPATAPAHARKGSAHVRVESERLDELMHMMGELVVNRTRVESLAAGMDAPGLSQALQDLARSSQALQALVMQVRMIPVEAVFLRLPRLVRDLSAKLGKRADLVLTGQDTELDRTVVDALGDPLVHLVRNAIDHGIEPPAERTAAGKPAEAEVEISARHAGSSVLISVRDDGRGVDPRRVAQKAAELGLLAHEAVDSVDMPRAIELLFAPGFSTIDEASDVSGRGVGMDAVRETINSLGGEVTLTSEPGKGTTAQIRLPLTLAIMSALLVETDGRPLALPLDRVERTLRLADHPVRSVAGTRMLVLRDGVIRLVDLASALGYAPAPETSHVVIVRSGDARLALLVDRPVGQRELVTRPLPAAVRCPALSGGAVLSNGEIALIVDCDRLTDADDSKSQTTLSLAA